jgi:hypothetical protein
MSSLNRSLFVLLPVVLFGSLTIVKSSMSAEPPKVSTYAPAQDLANQTKEYIKDLEKVVASEEDYKDGQEKIAKDANTLAVIALALGLHDEPNEYKESAASLIKAAQEVAAAKDYASAKKAVDAVKAAATTKDAGGTTLKWEKVAALPELMKQVPLINTKLKLKMKGKNFKKKAKDTAGYTAVLAAIAQGAAADTSATKNDEQVKQWQQLSAAARDLAGQLNAAIHKGDEAAAVKAMEDLNKSCEDCHAVFKPDVKE